MNTSALLRFAGLLALFPVLRLGAGGVAEGELPPEIAAALVRVEVVVQSSKGDEPKAAGWSRRCPKCGNYHDNALDDALADDRPAEVAGFLVAPDRVLTADPLIESRFVKEWRVRVGDDLVPARPKAWAADRSAMLLELERPAPVAPLAFSSEASGPLHTIHHGDEGNGWSVWMQPHQVAGWLLQDGKRHRTVGAGSLFVNAAGAPVAIAMSERLPAGDEWRRPYTDWPWIEREAYEAALAKIEAATSTLFLRAELELRAKPVRPGEEHNRWDEDEEEKQAGQPRIAVVIGPRRVLVLASLTPGLTARLESVRLHLGNGESVNATFVGSSDEYGTLVVDPGRDLPAAVAPADMPWPGLRDRMLFSADVRLAGEERVVHCGHLRIASLKTGYRGRAVPEFGMGIENTFLFDAEGRLVGLPLARRSKARLNRWDKPAPFMVSASEVVVFGGDPAAWADARNRPLSDEESRRLAWLGVDLQPLDADLALAHGVSTQTENGDHGALVTHVHAGSPAAQAGLKTGDVLLRFQPEGAVKPVQIKVDRHAFSDQPFPWERYDEINEAYYDRIPVPWLPAENTLHARLKDLGTGTPYRLDYARAGRVASLDLKVEAGPLHFTTAPELSLESAGLRLRELTFETRRFYQLPEEAAALIVARVEAGGTASVAGLKPYELITTVNDRPVATAAAFGEAMAAGGALRLGVRRMNQSRVVVLDAGPKPVADAPAP